MNIKTELRTYEISYENIEAALVHFLHSNRLVPLDWDILEVDIAIPLNDKGNVDFDITFAVPDKNPRHKKPNLKVVTNETQLSLFDV